MLGRDPLIPHHCSQVGLVALDRRPDAAVLSTWLQGRRIYQGTTHLVFEGADERAVVSVRASGKGLWGDVQDYTILGMGRELVGFVHDPSVDTLNHRSMATAASSLAQPLVVVKGEFEHVSFIAKEPAIPLFVVDAVPPTPSKLWVLTERALALVSHDLPLRPVPVFTDLQRWVDEASQTSVVLPCRCSGWSAGGRSLSYLEEQRPLADPAGSLLIGCELSRKLFLSTYHQRPIFRDMCPREAAQAVLVTPPDHGAPLSKPLPTLVLAKCCDLIERVELDPRGLAVVPWGARLEEVMGAVAHLASVARRACDREGVPSAGPSLPVTDDAGSAQGSSGASG